LKVYASTSCLKDCRDLAHVLDLYGRAGIKNIELGSSHEHIKDVHSLLSQYRGMDFTVHNYFPPARDPFIMNIAAQDNIIRDRSLEVCRAAIDLCSYLGASIYSFHPGFRVHGTLDGSFDLYGSVVPYEKAFEVLAESIESILSYAREHRVAVAIENLEHRNDAYMMTGPREFEELLDVFPELHVLLDLGHLKIASRRLGFTVDDFISCVREHVVGIHLHENDGVSDLHLEPLKSDMLKCLPQLSCPNIILECRNSSLGNIVRNLRALERYCDGCMLSDVSI